MPLVVAGLLTAPLLATEGLLSVVSSFQRLGRETGRNYVGDRPKPSGETGRNQVGRPAETKSETGRNEESRRRTKLLPCAVAADNITGG